MNPPVTLADAEAIVEATLKRNGGLGLATFDTPTRIAMVGGCLAMVAAMEDMGYRIARPLAVVSVS